MTERNYESAAKEIKDGLKPRAIVFLQEVRNAQCASNLAERVGLKVAAVSSFRNYDGRTGWQQCAILTDLPVEENEWKYFHGAKGLKGNPPRGYVRAKIDAGEDGVIDCICVHLKSNYGAGKDDGVKILNRRKREESAKQLPKDSPVAVVAGDFNFDAFSGEFKGEQTADILVWSGFSNTWAGVPLELRGTHPGKGRWPDTTLDYIFLKGLDSGEYPSLGSQGGVSDHRIVWLRASRAISPRRISFIPGLSNRKDSLQIFPVMVSYIYGKYIAKLRQKILENTLLTCGRHLWYNIQLFAPQRATRGKPRPIFESRWLRNSRCLCESKLENLEILFLRV